MTYAEARAYWKYLSLEELQASYQSDMQRLNNNKWVYTHGVTKESTFKEWLILMTQQSQFEKAHNL